MTNRERIDRLHREGTLPAQDFEILFSTFTGDDRRYAAGMAREIARTVFGKKIYFRGIIEFSNFCRNDCLYCGIRRSNRCVSRYRLSDGDILACCREGYALGYRTFVLQSGEDPYYNDQRLCGLISAIKQEFPDCAVTLSLGERSRDSYKRLKEAGADRYLLRHETADEAHYGMLHPPSMSWQNRMRCLRDLKELGFQTGCGMMIGTPGQTPAMLAEDMLFIQAFRPQMVGIGPFIPHRDTPFRDQPHGSVESTLLAMSLCRIMLPNVLLPSTTALGSVDGEGRKLGVLAGCNVIMPNLSPLSVRKKYLLYDGKAGVDSDAASGLRILRAQMEEIGCEVVTGRGDYQEGDTK